MIEKKESNAVPLDDENVVLRRSDKREIANVSLSNLNEVGEKHFLNKSQITNCLLEVPQRIKYELADGTLTIKAGSVVIVPYGTEDLTAQYPKGATFINDNFKVYDTQFEDGKFFVWAELQSDVISAKTGSTIVNQRLVYIIINTNGLDATYNNGSGTDGYSGTANCIYYFTDTNLIKDYRAGSMQQYICCLPLCVSKNNENNLYASIDQVLNGMGYIGSTVWADKGVKGLIPNGRNEDGSLKNIEFTTQSVLTQTRGLSGENKPLVLKADEFSNYITADYNEELNLNISITGTSVERAVVGTWSANSSGVITSLNPKLPFTAADAQDIDGMWTTSYLQFASNLSLDGYKGPFSATFDLSDYLPKDANIYEVIGTIVCRPETNSDIIDVRVWNSSSIPQIPSVCAAVGSNGTIKDFGSGNFIIPILADRILKLGVANSGANSAGTIALGRLVAYRKVR